MIFFTKSRSCPSLKWSQFGDDSDWASLHCRFKVKVAQQGHFGIKSTVTITQKR